MKPRPFPSFTVRTERRRYCILGVSLRRTQNGVSNRPRVIERLSTFPRVSIEPGSVTLNWGLFFFLFFPNDYVYDVSEFFPRAVYDDVKRLVRTQRMRQVLPTKTPPRTRPNFVSEKTRRKIPECGQHRGPFAAGSVGLAISHDNDKTP